MSCAEEIQLLIDIRSLILSLDSSGRLPLAPSDETIDGQIVHWDVAGQQYTSNTTYTLQWIQDGLDSKPDFTGADTPKLAWWSSAGVISGTTGITYSGTGAVTISNFGDDSVDFYTSRVGFLKYSSNTTGYVLRFEKARGTGTTAIVTGDMIATQSFYGYDGSNMIEAARIRVQSAGVIASTRVSSQMIFSVGIDAVPSTLTPTLYVKSNTSITYATIKDDTNSALSFIRLGSNISGFLQVNLSSPGADGIVISDRGTNTVYMSTQRTYFGNFVAITGGVSGTLTKSTHTFSGIGGSYTAASEQRFMLFNGQITARANNDALYEFDLDTTLNADVFTGIVRWGIYQRRNNRTNYFASPILIGITSKVGSEMLRVEGDVVLASNTGKLGFFGDDGSVKSSGWSLSNVTANKTLNMSTASQTDINNAFATALQALLDYNFFTA